jgi:hypothetical protein
MRCFQVVANCGLAIQQRQRLRRSRDETGQPTCPQCRAAMEEEEDEEEEDGGGHQPQAQAQQQQQQHQ